VTSSTKPEIHNLLHSRQRRTEPRPQLTCTENFVKGFVRLYERTDRHTDTGTLMAILRTPRGRGEVTTKGDTNDDTTLHRIITFCVSRRRREMYCGHARLCVCVCVCLSAAACLHYCTTDPGVTWRSGRGCPIVVHCWADLQSVNGWRCYNANAKR